MPMYFAAAVLIACSLLLSDGDAVAVWSLAVLLIGFRLGFSARKKGGSS